MACVCVVSYTVGTQAAADVTWDQHTADSAYIITDTYKLHDFYPADNSTLTIQTNGYTVTICQDALSANAEAAEAMSGSTYTGNVIVDGGGLYLGDSNTNIENRLWLSGNVLGSGGDLHLKNEAKLTLSMAQWGTVTFGKTVTMDNNTELHVKDGKYNISTINIADGDQATISHLWGNVLQINNLNAAGATLKLAGTWNSMLLPAF